MKPELEDKLIREFPEMFAQRHLGPAETCLCWGVCCGDGWYNIIYKLCMDICKYANENDTRIPEIIQIKEKFGGLRFYIDVAEDYIHDLIRVAEDDSYYTCEHCGSTDNIGQTRGWISTMCSECAAKFKAHTWRSYEDIKKEQEKEDMEEL